MRTSVSLRRLLALLVWGGAVAAGIYVMPVAVARRVESWLGAGRDTARRGVARIPATLDGEGSKATAGALQPPAPRAWPNEPPGFMVVSDEPFDALTEHGWKGLQRQATNGSGLFLETDPSAPLSPPNVLAFRFAAGFRAGSEPGVEFYAVAPPVRETYYGFWWKPSKPWQNNAASGVNKIAFLLPWVSQGAIYIMMFSEGTGYTIQVEPEFAADTRRLAPNVAATPVMLGTWHRIEWYVKYSTTATSRDGMTRWWLDGVLQGRYTDLQMPADAGFIEYQLAPTWGGVQGSKLETDTYWFDHARISQPSAAGR